MILIIGGAYQGKHAYAVESLGCPPSSIVPHVEKLIRGYIEEGKDPQAEIARQADGWQDSVLLLEDIACGVVPMDPLDRAWREAVGRCGAYLASRADRVIRVFCGIGTVLKDA